MHSATSPGPNLDCRLTARHRDPAAAGRTRWNHRASPAQGRKTRKYISEHLPSAGGSPGLTRQSPRSPGGCDRSPPLVRRRGSPEKVSHSKCSGGGAPLPPSIRMVRCFAGLSHAPASSWGMLTYKLNADTRGEAPGSPVLAAAARRHAGAACRARPMPRPRAAASSPHSHPQPDPLPAADVAAGQGPAGKVVQHVQVGALLEPRARARARRAHAGPPPTPQPAGCWPCMPLRMHAADLGIGSLDLHP